MAVWFCYIGFMSQHGNTTRTGKRSVGEVAEEVGVYPLEAYDFVQAGLRYTVGRIHGDNPRKGDSHVSGQQLALGLRDYALSQWGKMASAVLQRWNITCTYDFGRIVFAMVEGGILHKTDDDNIEDFRNVFDFAEFDSVYRIESRL